MDRRMRLVALGEFSTELISTTIGFGGATAMMLISSSVRRKRPLRRMSDAFEDSI